MEKNATNGKCDSYYIHTRAHAHAQGIIITTIFEKCIAEVKFSSDSYKRTGWTQHGLPRESVFRQFFQVLEWSFTLFLFYSYSKALNFYFRLFWRWLELNWQQCLESIQVDFYSQLNMKFYIQFRCATIWVVLEILLRVT